MGGGAIFLIFSASADDCVQLSCAEKYGEEWLGTYNSCENPIGDCYKLGCEMNCILNTSLCPAGHNCKYDTTAKKFGAIYWGTSGCNPAPGVSYENYYCPYYEDCGSGYYRDAFNLCFPCTDVEFTKYVEEPVGSETDSECETTEIPNGTKTHCRKKTRTVYDQYLMTCNRTDGPGGNDSRRSSCTGEADCRDKTYQGKTYSNWSYDDWGEWTYSCNAGYYKPADSECTECPSGYYCPGDDKSDDAIPCPADTTDWNTLLEGCGYHPEVQITGTVKSGTGLVSNRESGKVNIEQCFVSKDGVKFKEGYWLLEQTYNPENNNYWHGCDELHYFYQAKTGYYLDGFFGYTHIAWYNYIRPCTNAPENAHYTSYGYPESNNCPWVCDDGYGKTFDDVCVSLCTAGMSTLHAGEKVAVPLYDTRHTTPSIVIQNKDKMCYVNLVEGNGPGLNVDYNGTVYHTSN